jgi:acetyl esterase/lipase
MSHPIKVVLRSLTLVMSSVGLFLSSWIVIPAPTMPLLTLAVGAPEVSPILLVFNVIALLLSVANIRYQLQRFSLIASILGLLICAVLLINISPTQRQMETAMQRGLGENYLIKIPAEVKADMRLRPFVMADVFGGIRPGKTRHITGIQVANTTLNMEIYQPPQVGKYPAIVVVYGGAWRNGSPALNADFNQYMAARGYTVFAIDYRHAPQYRFPAQLDDVRSSLAFIRLHAAEYEADPERMAILGRSSGAHLAMLAAYSADAPPLRAVVDYYGPINLTAGYNNPPHPDPIDSRAVLKAFLGGSPQDKPILYQNASPVNYVRPNNPPTLLIYGSRDNVVPVRYGKELFSRLEKAGNTAIFLEIPWASHSFDSVFNGVSNQLALYYTERFLACELLR